MEDGGARKKYKMENMADDARSRASYPKGLGPGGWFGVEEALKGLGGSLNEMNFSENEKES